MTRWCLKKWRVLWYHSAFIYLMLKSEFVPFNLLFSADSDLSWRNGDSRAYIRKYGNSPQ
jgi:hypothetical protein